MDLFVFLALLQDGITTSAIYLLLAIGLFIVFSVTRVIFVPQGDLLAFGTLTVAALQSGHLPGTLWLLDGVSAVALVVSLFHGRRAAIRGVLGWGGLSDRGDARRGVPRAAPDASDLDPARAGDRYADGTTDLAFRLPADCRRPRARAADPGDGA